MRLFITGISGLLGLNVAHLARNTFAVSGCTQTSSVSIQDVNTIQLDLRDIDSADTAIRAIQPDVILHTAALTNVDLCETDPNIAHSINVTATKNIAEIAAALGSKLVHISTDQLFDGTAPWRSERDHPAPLNVYGETKLAAEKKVMESSSEALIVRTNFFGWGTKKRESFSDWILNGLGRREKLTMFTDVFFTPILINQLAEVIFSLVEGGASGVYHVAGSERVSKHEFALRVAEVFGYSNENISGTSVAGASLKARRPSDMSLNCEKTEAFLNIKMPTIAEGLNRLNGLQLEGWPMLLEKAWEAKQVKH